MTSAHISATVDEYTDGWITDLLADPPDATKDEWKQAVERLWLELRRLKQEKRGALELLAVLVEKAGGRVLLEDRLMRVLDRKALFSYRDERQGGTVYEVKSP